MHDLHVTLFGLPQVRCGNEQTIIQRRKDLALLIYLIVTSQPHSRDTLATLLWQDHNQAKARSNLRKSLSRLHSELGEKYLVASQDQVSIHPKVPIYLDIAQFRSLVRQSREHGHSTDPGPLHLCTRCEKALEEAALLYRADFLKGFNISDSNVFDEWQFFQAESLHRDLAEILEHLTKHYSYMERYDTAIEHCRRWLSLDRLHEPAHRQLMALYALSGQRSAAKRQFEECAGLLKTELEAEPEQETLQLYDAIQNKNFRGVQIKPVSAQSKPGDKDGINTSFHSQQNTHNLPVPSASFIGRARELGELVRILRDPACRLLTLLGPGGSGKTRLAVQIGSILNQDAAAPFQDHVWFVPLAQLLDPQSITGAILQSLRITGHDQGPDLREKLLGHLHGRQMLLILDNFEHLVSDDSIQLISDAASAAPLSKILITSRERLNIEGEYVFQVEGLEYPPIETLPSKPTAHTVSSAFSALQLFEQCAARVQPSFTITQDNHRAIVQICQNVQGMPLAIELAASWIEVLSPQEIHAEIVRNLDFLQSNWRDLPDRQRSLRAVFDASWSLLDKRTRPILKALCVFRTSFTREAAYAVSGASPKTLLDLTHKSWIHRLPNGRYQIHELLRQFGFQKLEKETSTLQLIQKQYCDYYVAYSASLWDAMKGSDQSRAFLGIEAEFDNLHMAWRWLLSGNSLETAIQTMLPMLFHYAELREKAPELMNMVDLALDSLSPYYGNSNELENAVILLTVKGSFFHDGYPLRYSMHDAMFPIDAASVQQAWRLSQKRGNFAELGFWGVLLAYIYGRIIDLNDGVRQIKKMIHHFERNNRSWDLATAYLHLLRLSIPYQKKSPMQFGTLTRHLSQAMNIFTSLGDAINTGHTLSLWGDLKHQQQDIKGAIQQWKSARNHFLAVDEWGTATNVLWQLCEAYIQLGDFAKAFDCCEEMAASYIEHGLKQSAVGALSKESYEKVRYGNIGEALQIRQRCIDLIEETGLAYQIAWNYWEMGEVMRVARDLDKAAEWFERSHTIFEQAQDNIGRSFYFRGMADIALETHAFDSARENFSTSVELARTVNHTWMLAYTLNGLGKSELGLRRLSSAEKHMKQALRYAIKTHDTGIALVLLSGYASLLRAQEKNEKAAELALLITGHFASWHETKMQAASLLDELGTSLPEARLKQAQKTGHALEIWKTMDGLLKKRVKQEISP